MEKGDRKDKNKMKKQEKEKKTKVKSLVTISRNPLVELCAAIRNQMYTAVTMASTAVPSKLTDFELTTRFKQLKEKNGDLHANYVKLMRNLSQSFFGVWQPKIFLKSADNTYGGALVVTNGAAALVNAISIQAQMLASISLLWAIFDEYRPVGPFRIQFIPSDTSTSRLYGVGVIDYSNSSSLTTVAEAMSYDTAKIFDVMPYHTHRSGYTEWFGHVVGIPDKQWITTGTDATWAYWKSYSYNAADASWSISATYGYLYYEMEIEFRQLNQGG